MSKTVWIAGASGLVGQQLVRLLIEDPEVTRIVAFVRKELVTEAFKHSKVEQFITDFNPLKAPTKKVDALFCALGSTTKKTPKKSDYYRIDVTYPLEFAKLGLKHGAKFYGLVSAHGANANSFSAYLKMKGVLEEQLKSLAFTRLAIARPSLLKGDRKEFRLIEKLSESLMDCLPGNYKAIHVENVAGSLIAAFNKSSKPIRILTSAEMQNPGKINFPAQYL